MGFFLLFCFVLNLLYNIAIIHIQKVYYWLNPDVRMYLLLNFLKIHPTFGCKTISTDKNEWKKQQTNSRETELVILQSFCAASLLGSNCVLSPGFWLSTIQSWWINAQGHNIWNPFILRGVCIHRHVHTNTHTQTHIHTQHKVKEDVWVLEAFLYPTHSRHNRGGRERPIYNH